MEVVKMKLSLTLTLLLVSSCSTLNSSLRVVCYFNLHSLYRQGDAKFTVDDINSTLCTHLVYNYANLNFSHFAVESADPYGDITNKGYEKIVGLKDKNPNLKVMIALHNSNRLPIPEAYSEEQIRSLIESVVDFLSLHKFDGIDLDLGYYQSKGFVNLVEALGRIRHNHGYLLSLVLRNSDVAFIDNNDVSSLKHVLDFLNLRTYEFHVSYSNPYFADHHAPLYRRTWDNNNQINNVDSVVRKWISKGFSPDKIVVGIPLFGVSWTLSSFHINPPASANGPGVKGQAIDISGYSAYYEICQYVQNQRWNVIQVGNKNMGPYATSPYSSTDYRTWVGYDDPEMAIVKSKYILSNKLGGAAVANVEFDDFHNRCGAGRNPIMTAIYNTLKAHLSTMPLASTKTLSTTNPANHPNSSLESFQQPPEKYLDTTVDKICFPSTVAFAIPLVILALLLVILIHLFAKIFCCRKATDKNNLEIPLSPTSKS